MKKYLYIFKSELMTNLQYTFDILIGFISYVIMIFIFLNLWKYIYSDPSQVIKGYTMNQMIWYVIVTEILWMSLGGRKLSKKICDDVKSGNITYNIIKPYNYVEYILFNHLGITVLKFVLLTILGMLLGFISLGTFPHLTFFQIIGILISCFLATTINIILITFLGLISFFIEDASPFYWIYSKVILVLGTIFPIEFFPLWIQPIMKYSPIFVVSYAPAKLFVDFKWETFLESIIVQIAYLVVCFILTHWIYKKGVRKLNVNGG